MSKAKAKAKAKHVDPEDEDAKIHEEILKHYGSLDDYGDGATIKGKMYVWALSDGLEYFEPVREGKGKSRKTILKLKKEGVEFLNKKFPKAPTGQKTDVIWQEGQELSDFVDVMYGRRERHQKQASTKENDLTHFVEMNTMFSIPTTDTTLKKYNKVAEAKKDTAIDDEQKLDMNKKLLDIDDFMDKNAKTQAQKEAVRNALKGKQLSELDDDEFEKIKVKLEELRGTEALPTEEPQAGAKAFPNKPSLVPPEIKTEVKQEPISLSDEEEVKQEDIKIEVKEESVSPSDEDEPEEQKKEKKGGWLSTAMSMFAKPSSPATPVIKKEVKKKEKKQKTTISPHQARQQMISDIEHNLRSQIMRHKDNRAKVESIMKKFYNTAMTIVHKKEFPPNKQFDKMIDEIMMIADNETELVKFFHDKVKIEKFIPSEMTDFELDEFEKFSSEIGKDDYEPEVEAESKEKIAEETEKIAPIAPAIQPEPTSVQKIAEGKKEDVREPDEQQVEEIKKDPYLQQLEETKMADEAPKTTEHLKTGVDKRALPIKHQHINLKHHLAQFYVPQFRPGITRVNTAHRQIQLNHLNKWLF